MERTLIINSAASGGQAHQEAITYVNPDATADTLKEFAHMTNALTTNTYINTARVDKTDSDNSK